MAYYIGQAFGLMTTACALIMPFMKKKWQLLCANILLNGLVILNLVLIGQLGSACYLCLVAIIQSVLALLRIKNEKPVSTTERFPPMLSSSTNLRTPASSVGISS